MRLQQQTNKGRSRIFASWSALGQNNCPQLNTRKSNFLWQPKQIQTQTQHTKQTPQLPTLPLSGAQGYMTFKLHKSFWIVLAPIEISNWLPSMVTTTSIFYKYCEGLKEALVKSKIFTRKRLTTYTLIYRLEDQKKSPVTPNPRNSILSMR